MRSLIFAAALGIASFGLLAGPGASKAQAQYWGWSNYYYPAYTYSYPSYYPSYSWGYPSYYSGYYYPAYSPTYYYPASYPSYYMPGYYQTYGPSDIRWGYYSGFATYPGYYWYPRYAYFR